MKTIHIFGLSLMMAVAFTFASCNNELEEAPTMESVETMQSVPVTMSATLTPFDASMSVSSRATTLTWKEGDVIYLQYTTADGGTTKGTATYHSGSWAASYDKPLKRDAVTACKAYFFDGKSTASATEVAIEPTTGIYADFEATYNYPTGGILSITCNLKPQTSRIRFKGIAGTAFELSGLSCGNSFTLSSATLSKSSTIAIVRIQSDGYSPYIYGNFANTSLSRLIIDHGGYTYLAECEGLDILKTGESGYMTLPVADKHNGWRMIENTKSFTVGDIKFYMTGVLAGTFEMGKNNGTGGGSDETPVHTVTLCKDYYIGSYEVTQELWKAVMGSDTETERKWSDSYGLGDDYPAYYVSYEDAQEFINKLNRMTNQQFRLPTEAEWEFAAKGGILSQGYTYSGSDNIDEVAWYIKNSEGSTWWVCCKHTNELGINDMSGNVGEWCSDWYGSYSSDAVTDPTGPTSGSSRVFRGGSWYRGAGGCRTAYRYYGTPTYRDNDLGFRLAL